MKNKLVAVLLAITMVLAICIGVVAVNAAEKLQIVIETVEAKPGDEVEVKINLVNNEAISSLKADVSWPDTLTLLYAEYDIYNPKDKSAMINEPDEVDDDFNPIWDGITGHFVFNWLTAKSKVSGDTAFVTLKFKVADDASGLQEIKATINPSDVFVNDGDDTPNVDFELVNGGVNVPAESETEPEGSETEPEGSETEPEGSETEPEGSETEPEGSETEPEGSETEPEGSETEPEGSETEPDESEPDVNKLKVVIDSVEANPGDTVAVAVNLIDNPGISSIKAVISWPAELELQEAVYDIYNPKDKSAMISEPDEIDDDFNPIWTGVTGSFVFNWLSARTKVEGDTAFVTLTFKVAESAEAGFYAVTAVIDEEDVFVNDGDETPNVPFELTDGGVTVAQSAVYYTVSFNSDGGTEVASQSVLAGETVEKPADPEKENYNFVEWRLNGETYDFSQPVNGDIELTAVYVKREAQIEDQSNEAGDEGITGEATSNYDIVKVGFKVDGNEDQIIWKDIPADDVGKSVSYDVDFEELGLEPGSHTIEIVVEVDDGENTILPVTTDPIEVTVDEPLPQEFEIVIDNVEAKPGDEVEVKINLVGNPGVSSIKADVSWPADLELINAVYDIYNPKDKSAMINEPDEVDDDYNPIWTGVSGHFVFNWITAKSKVTGDTTFVTLTFKVSETATNGLKVVDADISDDDVFVNVDGGNEFEELDYTFTAGGVNVTGGVEVNEYTVTFNSDGGSEVEAQTVEDGAKATKPADPTKEGFTFKGWKLGADDYDFETPVTADITLTAAWEEIPAVPESDGPKINVDAVKVNGTDDFTGEIKEGDKLSILGWAYGKNSNLKKIVYSVGGADVECPDVYRDRPDLATVLGIDPFFGTHAGFGKDDQLLELTGIDALTEGEYTLTIKAIFNDDTSITKEYSLKVTKEAEPLHLINVSYDGLYYDGTLKLKEGGVDKQIILPENRSELDFTKGDVKVITVRGWARVSENTADIKGFGYSIDGGDVVEGEFIQDRPDLADSGFPGGVGFNVNIPVEDLEEGEHSIDIYLITSDGEQIKIVKDRSTAEEQIINQVGVTFTVNKPDDGPDNPDNPPTADVAIMAVAAVAAVALAGVMIGKKALKKY